MLGNLYESHQLKIDTENIENVAESLCCYCSMQCGLEVRTRGRFQAESSISGNRKSPSAGRLCQKGISAFEHVRHQERLTTPLRRRNGKLEPCSWEEALDEIVHRFKWVQQQAGRSAVGVYGGGSLTNEKAYLLGKFARVALQTPNIDYNGRYCMSSAAAACNQAFGVDRGLPFPLTDIEEAEVILLVGANIAECQPTILPYFRNAQKRGATLIVIDPRYTLTAKLADLHIPIHPGTDSWLMNGILHVLVQEGLVDTPFIEKHTTGFASVVSEVSLYDPHLVEQMTEVPKQQIEQIAHLIAKKRTMIFSARGIEQRSSGVDQVLSCINIVLATGNIGKIGTGYGAITGQANGQGGREHGQKADQLPGYRNILNPKDRAEISAIWKIPEDQLPGAGLSAYEMFESMTDGKIKGLFVMASNLLVSSPNRAYVKAALESLHTLVVVDLFLSETALSADFVLPGSSWTEEMGTTTSLEGRVMLRETVHLPPGAARCDWEILCDLADRFGCRDQFAYQTVEEIFQELCRATKGARADYSGITYEKLKLQEEDVMWPYTEGAKSGTKRLFTKSFAHSDGKAHFIPVKSRRPAEIPDVEYPYYLTTGRVIHHYLTGTFTRRTVSLNARCKEPFAEIAPAVATSLQIEEGDLIFLESRRGQIRLKARVTDTIRPDTVFVPFHWEFDQSINDLTTSVFDPVSKMPEFKSCAIKIYK